MANLRIKEAIKAHGLTVEQVAKRMGILPSALSQSINGNPTVEKLEKIASALGVEVTELFAKRGDFVAFVRRNGDTHTFDTEKDLIEYAETLKTE